MIRRTLFIPKGKGVCVVHRDGVISGKLPDGVPMPEGFRYPTQEEIDKKSLADKVADK